jgi:ribosomal protein S18 acetylase RimI-like enzyme
MADAEGSVRRTVDFEIKPAIVTDIPELAQLFDDYRVFYEAESALVKAEAFVSGLVNQRSTRFFLAREAEGYPLLGFVHLMPSMNTIAMRPIWVLEDLFVVADARRTGVASALMRHAETFARETSAERLTLATAHNNRRAQSLYKRLGYVRDEHFWYYYLALQETPAKPAP